MAKQPPTPVLMVRVRAVGEARVSRITAEGGMIPMRWYGRNARGQPLPHGEEVPDGYHIQRAIRSGALEECAAPPVEALPTEAPPPAAPVTAPVTAPVPTAPPATPRRGKAPPEGAEAVAPPAPTAPPAPADPPASEAPAQ